MTARVRETSCGGALRTYTTTFRRSLSGASLEADTARVAYAALGRRTEIGTPISTRPRITARSGIPCPAAIDDPAGWAAAAPTADADPYGVLVPDALTKSRAASTISSRPQQKRPRFECIPV